MVFIFPWFRVKCWCSRTVKLTLFGWPFHTFLSVKAVCHIGTLVIYNFLYFPSRYFGYGFPLTQTPLKILFLWPFCILWYHIVIFCGLCLVYLWPDKRDITSPSLKGLGKVWLFCQTVRYPDATIGFSHLPK